MAAPTPDPDSTASDPALAIDVLFAVGEDVMMEFKGGRLDGMKVLKSEWPKGQAWPGTEILDKPSGQLYRYHLPSSTHHAVYTHRPDDSANITISEPHEK